MTIVLTTCASKKDAERIAGILVKERLCACVNIWPVRSVYQWQKKIAKSGEWMIMGKTSKAKMKKVAARIRVMHSYKLPIIETWETTLFSKPARQWLDKSLKIG